MNKQKPVHLFFVLKKMPLSYATLIDYEHPCKIYSVLQILHHVMFLPLDKEMACSHYLWCLNIKHASRFVEQLCKNVTIGSVSWLITLPVLPELLVLHHSPGSLLFPHAVLLSTGTQRQRFSLTRRGKKYT